MKNCLFASLLFILACNPAGRKVQDAVTAVPHIIFETDIGNDVDDALALDMIYKYLDEGKVNLLAICSNKESPYSTEYIDLMNRWYGYPDIPVGKVVNGADSEGNARKYADHVCLMKDEQGGRLFPRPAFDYEALPEAVSLYRKILSVQPDSSVTIVSVGFSTNIVRLLQSLPDNHSDLSGKELIARKVKLLSVMAGSFGEKRIAEYNVVKDIPAAQILAEDWPTPIVYTPFEAGMAVLYPASAIENGFAWTTHHPVVEAYKYYLDMPYDRPSWDMIALLYAVENSPEYFTQSSWGNISVDDQGFTSFTPDENGDRACLELNAEQAAKTLSRFVELTTRQPKNRLVYEK
ncbi:MAG: nucleoside hydrolase [Dysgonamonadaceae bacterium]|jgi:inosine-uridine nucleoside N-ribohydrolase|nr:nucleoside hydrolase [Dysgonamonadaceae bacterium]